MSITTSFDSKFCALDNRKLILAGTKEGLIILYQLSQVEPLPVVL